MRRAPPALLGVFGDRGAVLNFILRRILAAIPVLVLVVTIIFALVRLIPGDPAITLLGPGATEQQISALRQQLRLDEPVVGQYFGYIGNLLRGDLGQSLRTNQPIAGEIASRLPATIELSLFALLLSIVVGVPIGILSAVRPRGVFDNLTRVVALVGVSAPTFWLALLAQVIFALGLNLLPVSGRLDLFMDAPRITGLLVLDGLLSGRLGVTLNALLHLILPASVIAAFLGATVARLVRASMLEEINQDYVNTARSKGLAPSVVIVKHVVRNALLPTITIVGLKFAELLGGAILTETVFSWPGIGRYMFEAISVRDYPVIQAGTLMFAIVFIASSAIADILYSFVNPRIRLE